MFRNRRNARSTFVLHGDPSQEKTQVALAYMVRISWICRSFSLCIVRVDTQCVDPERECSVPNSHSPNYTLPCPGVQKSHVKTMIGIFSIAELCLLSIGLKRCVDDMPGCSEAPNGFWGISDSSVILSLFVLRISIVVSIHIVDSFGISIG